MDKDFIDAVGRGCRLLAGRTPMLRVAAALCGGIVLWEYGGMTGVWVPRVALAALVLLLLSAFCRGRVWRVVFRVSLAVVLVAMGWWLPALQAPADPLAAEGAGWRTMLVQLEDTPHATAKCVRMPARVLAVAADGGVRRERGRVMLSIRRDGVSSLHYGQRLWVRGVVERPSADVHGFDYRRYLRRRGMLWQCYVPAGRWVPAGAEAVSLRGWSKGVQAAMVRRLDGCGLTERQRGVAAALLLGWRDEVGDEVWRQYRAAGIQHVLCVSGLHVGIVAWMAGAWLFFLGRGRWQRVVCGVVRIAAVWLYVLLTGMAPATLRAGVMFSLIVLGQMGDRPPNTLNNLFASMVVLLVAEPMWLFDVGFQLSYAAVVGIVAWYGPLCRLVPSLANAELAWWLWVPRKLWQTVCLSTAAQLGTLPLVLYHFHQFPVYFLVANVLVVPFAGLLLATVAAVVLTTAWPWLGTTTTALLRWELAAADGVTAAVGRWPHAMLTDIYFDLPMALALVVALACLTVLLSFFKEHDGQI